MLLIIISKKVKINPDNVATPMAGSIGDVGTLITLASIGTFFYNNSKFWNIRLAKLFLNYTLLRRKSLDPFYFYGIFFLIDSFFDYIFKKKSICKINIETWLGTNNYLDVNKQVTYTNCKAISILSTCFFFDSFSGIVLREAINAYNGIESYQPVINGIGGNLVSIYSARLSTEISRDAGSFGSWAKWAPNRLFTFPYHTFFGNKSKTLLIC
jgi:solute carrier family 41